MIQTNICISIGGGDHWSCQDEELAPNWCFTLATKKQNNNISISKNWNKYIKLSTEPKHAIAHFGTWVDLCSVTVQQCFYISAKELINKYSHFEELWLHCLFSCCISLSFEFVFLLHDLPWVALSYVDHLVVATEWKSQKSDLLFLLD